jgi:hypothetical protein
MTDKKSIEELYAQPTEALSGNAGAPEAQAAPTGEAQPQPQPQPGQQATLPPKVEPGAPPAPASEKADKTVPLTALEDERRKRRELEQRLAGLEQKLRPQDEAPDPLLNPDEFRTSIAVERFEDKLQLTSELLIEKVGEETYRTAEQAVLARAQADPAFARSFGHEVSRAKNPAKFTLDAGRKLIEEAEAADPVKLRERLKAEILAELNGGQQPAAQAAAKPAVRVPTSLADVQSQVARNAGARAVKRRSIEELYQ